ncbi:MAG: hypothetical protein P4L85_03535 [Paludisphaera borealis]|uniref:hypothetical protein n=1 Tax=Paludisphaera borealis TaxID=1387353 RepID=UPI00283DB4AD|nr:hypothetical protein [Paludisphaera borealis]MDR3618398.1 hypothetical protein [Paludisphaera borealis]
MRIEALYVAPALSTGTEAPFQAADVRSLRGVGPTDDVAAVGPDGLADAVKNIVSRPDAAVVVYVSAPVIGNGPDALIGSASIRSLIDMVVKDARRDVVLALDLAQVDSDRDLGVYGNCPYEGLAEMVSGLTAGDRCVYILTSSAPAQKSWGADGLGRSTFAHYLREGLSGKAQGWDAPETYGQVSAEGLHRYVHRHVSHWAKDHRNAVQTPILLRIGGGSRKITLPYRKDLGEQPPRHDEAALAAKPAAASASAPEPTENPATAKNDASAAEKNAPTAEPTKVEPSAPRDRVFADLIKEWKQHDDLRKQRPYHELPETWRSYQAGLLRAERWLRAAWRNPESIDSVQKALEDVGRRRGELQDRLKTILDSDAAFPLRPARGAEAGKRAITDSLIYLTGAGPEEDDLYAAPPLAKEAPDAPKAAKPKPIDPPKALADAQFGGFPEPYLELQLPAWAMRFSQEFAVPDHFKDDRRGSILRRLVQVRARAEDALALDRRGLDWIRPILSLSDDQRRAVQDQLFAPDLTTEDVARQLNSDIARFDRNYASALEVVQVYQDARKTWERAAAELPELAEWAVRAGQGAPTVQSLPTNPLPSAVERGLSAAAALVDILDRNPPPEKGASFLELIQKPASDLQAATRNAQVAIDELEKQLFNTLRTDGPREWIALDAALRTPLVPVENRRRLLDTILNMGERLELKADASTIDAAENTPDPGFWSRAMGLAGLDRDLRRIGRADHPETEDSARFLKDAWSVVQTAPAALDTVAQATPLLKQYEAAAMKERVQNSGARAERHREKDRKPEDVGLSLRLDDRAVRLLCEGAIRREDLPADVVSQDWEAFAKYDTLLFHIERLRQDYAPTTASLRRLVEELARPLGIAENRDRPRVSPTLRIVTTPPASSSLKIGEDGKAALSISVGPPEDGVVRSEPLPRGKAFLGVAAPPPGLRISGVDSASNSPPGRLEEVGPSAQEGRPVKFTVSQVDLKSNETPFKALAKIFFRGRVDEGGAAVVDVIPKAFPNLVLVDISQDPQDLETRFGKGAAERIEDQFKRHPREGYMHEGKHAAYILTLKNVTFQKLTVAYKRTLSDPGNTAQPIPIDEAEKQLVIAPGESVSISGKVTSLEAPKGQVRDLKVSLSVKESKEAVPEFVVRFRQIDHASYMVFETFIRPDDFENVRQQCYVVRFTRRADDPVREPIKGGELSCTIEGVTGRGLSAEAEILPGESIKTTRPAVSGKNQFTWTGRVENEVLPPRQAP